MFIFVLFIQQFYGNLYLDCSKIRTWIVGVPRVQTCLPSDHHHDPTNFFICFFFAHRAYLNVNLVVKPARARDVNKHANKVAQSPINCPIWSHWLSVTCTATTTLFDQSFWLVTMVISPTTIFRAMSVLPSL